MTKDDFYHDFLLIRKMRAPTRKRCRMLGELFACDPDAWRVVGITEEALKIFATHNFNRVSRMGVNRSHLVDRNTTYTTMIEGPLLEKNKWWNFYRRNDKTILATSSENMSNNFSTVYDIDASLDLFKSQGFAWRHREPEVLYLKEVARKNLDML